MNSNCPVCDAHVPLSSDVQVSEVILCPECKTRLVVDNIHQQKISLLKAPEVEEDWGE